MFITVVPNLFNSKLPYTVHTWSGDEPNFEHHWALESLGMLLQHSLQTNKSHGACLRDSSRTKQQNHTIYVKSVFFTDKMHF